MISLYKRDLGLRWSLRLRVQRLGSGCEVSARLATRLCTKRSFEPNNFLD